VAAAAGVVHFYVAVNSIDDHLNWYGNICICFCVEDCTHLCVHSCYCLCTHTIFVYTDIVYSPTSDYVYAL